MCYTFLYVLSFLLVFNYAQSHTQDCPKLYLRYSKDHSYCQPRNASCNIRATYLSQKEIDQVLDMHNKYRSKVATQSGTNLPKAANMLQMEWDDELAAVAQKRAEQCIYEHDLPNQRRVLNFGVGQNIAFQGIEGKNIRAPPANWTHAMKGWFDEIIYFTSDLVRDYQKETSEDEEYGHFSQLVWADTFRVGCGYVLYHHENNYTRLYVCNYGPGGNIYTTSVYKIGRPGSHCPQNTAPVNNPYPGLCKRINDEAPFTPLKQPTLLFCNFQDQNSKDCGVSFTGVPPVIYPALGGNFLEIELQPGQKTTLTFAKMVKPSSKTFCVVLTYRKGPTIDGKALNSEATETFTIPSSDNYAVSKPLKGWPDNLQAFGPFSMDLGWNQETRIDISFKVDADATPQFLNIRSITAVNGKCNAFKKSLKEN